MAPTPTRWLWPAATAVALAALAVAGWYGYALVAGRQPAPPPVTRPAEPPGDLAEQVGGFCGGACHASPPPDTFPRRYWRKEVERGFHFYERSGLSLRPPSVEAVVRYYENLAPEELTGAAIPPASRPLGVRFEKVTYPGPGGVSQVSISHLGLVRLPPPGTPAPAGKGPLDVLACDMLGGLVMVLRPADPAPRWKVLARVTNPARAEVLDLDGDGVLDLVVACLGSFPPTDRRCGSVVWLRGAPDGSFSPHTLLENVGRIADVQAADFRGVGKKDLVAAAFGWQDTGELLYLENRTTDWGRPSFTARSLDPRHGAIHVPVADLDGDGKPDFVALFAQEHEAVVAFLNQGGGRFRQQTLYSAPHPGYGSSGIQLADLDGDGKLDVVYSNGDTLDEPHIFKPYHGVQWLRNLGGLRFEHRPLTPMYGVHRAVAGPITGSGRQDVLCVSFLPEDKFPDRATRAADAVVLLEQVAPGKFERHSLARGNCDHVTCAAGDVYGTGRQDLVVAGFGGDARAPLTVWRNLGRPAGPPPRGGAGSP